ncbi:MAG: 3-oxoacyl-ACP reductase FabG [Candidatus Thermoplasmatota archaeon]|nr:3-oxoacyl-ACP reductase FabG [Candidatus Thermoplasmatota archaeon]MBU1940447.1 3-oxoacyl-ACP reductase FabG [Candidatus Thermoplasmatota archaeon]
MDLLGKSAIVTGGSLGIGATIAIELAREGADIAINYRKHDAEAKAVAKQIEDFGRKCLVIKADVTSYSDAEAMFKQVLDTYSKLDILVCNAGINKDRVIWKMSEQDWDNVINVNLKGYFIYNKLAAAQFKDQRSGKIINITSINGIRGKFGQCNYSASKGGIIALTKALAKEVGKFNVNVNTIAPGMVMTEMAKNIPPEFLQKAVDETVLGRVATTEDIANVVVFLCTEKARHITGEVIKVDGGQYI